MRIGRAVLEDDGTFYHAIREYSFQSPMMVAVLDKLAQKKKSLYLEKGSIKMKKVQVEFLVNMSSGVMEFKTEVMEYTEEEINEYKEEYKEKYMDEFNLPMYVADQFRNMKNLSIETETGTVIVLPENLYKNTLIKAYEVK